MDPKVLALKKARLLEAREREAQAKPSEGGGYSSNFMLKSAWDQAQKFGESMAHGSSIGEHLPIIGEPIAKAGEAIGSGIAAATKAPFVDESVGELYAENQKRNREAQAERDVYDAASPAAMLVKSTAANLTVPGVSASRTAKLIPEATSWAGKAGKFGLETAERAAKSAGLSAADTLSRGGSGEDALESAKYAGMVQGGADVLPKLVQLGGTAYRKGMAGLSKEQTDYYRANPGRIMARDMETEASRLGEAAEGIKEKARNIGEDVKADVRSLSEQASGEAGLREQAAIGSAKAAKKQGFSEADEIQRSVAEDLSSAQKHARKSVNEAAYDAMKIAEDSGAMIKLAPFKAALTKRLKEFKVGKTTMGGGVDVIEALRQRLDDIGQKEISAIEFRRLIKSLDDDIENIMASTAKAGYITPGQRELTNVRKGFKEKMESKDEFGNEIVPGYAGAQAKTAGKTRALSGLQENFDYDPDAVYRQLKGINDPGKRGQAEAIRNFESEFGGDYSQRMGQAEAKRGVDYAAQAKPELDRAAEMRQQKFRDYFQDRLEEARRLRGTASGVTEGNAPGLMTRFGQNPEKNYPIGRKMERIALEENKPGMTGSYSPGDELNLPMPKEAYGQAARDLANQRAMTGSFTRGSRNVNLGAMSLAGAGNLLGAGMEKFTGLGTIGAFIGGASDLMGPSVVRRVIDIVDSPMGQRFQRIYAAAADQGPKAIALTHAMLMQKDPEYKKLMQEGGQQ